MQKWRQVSDDFGLTVSITIMKHMVTGRLMEESDKEAFVLFGGEISAACKFPYFGFRQLRENGRRGGQKSGTSIRSLWCPEEGCLSRQNLSLATKRRLYDACALSGLLYGI